MTNKTVSVDCSVVVLTHEGSSRRELLMYFLQFMTPYVDRELAGKEVDVILKSINYY